MPESRFAGDSRDISPVSAPSLDDLIAVVGARGLPYEQQIAALQRGVDEGILRGRALDTLREAGLA